VGSHLGHLDFSSPSHLIQPTIHLHRLSRNPTHFLQVASRSSTSVKAPPHPLTFRCRLHRVAKLRPPPSPSRPPHYSHKTIDFERISSSPTRPTSDGIHCPICLVCTIRATHPVRLESQEEGPRRNQPTKPDTLAHHVFSDYSCWALPRQVPLSDHTITVCLTMDLSPRIRGFPRHSIISNFN
jgi:hypothetical protein